MADKQHKRGDRGHAFTKMARLDATRRMLYEMPDGLTAQEIATALTVTRQQASGYLRELGAVETEKRGRYTLLPSDDEVKLARAILQRHGAISAAARLQAKQVEGHES